MQNEANEQAQPTEQVVMQIILTKECGVKVVSGLLGDKMACYGLLEVAKDAVREAHAPKVISPVGNFLNGLRQNGHKVK